MYHFFITAEPFHVKNTGDFDYIEEFIHTLPLVSHSPSSLLSSHSQPQLHFQNYVLQHFTKFASNKKLFLQYYHQFKSSPQRKELIQYFINEILSKTEENIQPILIIEYRAPESGAVFYPEDIELFHYHNIKVLIVVHEFYINTLRPYFKKVTVDLCNHCDLTYFFNKIDYQEAIKFGFHGKHAFTMGLETVNLNSLIATPSYFHDTEDFKDFKKYALEMKDSSSDSLISPTLSRPENILYFGLIRPNKGFVNALKLGELLEKHQSPMKIFITGKCELNNPLIKDWIQKIQSPVLTSSFTVQPKYQKNVELILNPSDSKLIYIINQCQYAYKTDGKGFANNSSSLLNLMAFGCILFTKSSQFTPSHAFSSKAMIFQKEISMSVMDDKVPTPEFVYQRILLLNQHPEVKEKLVKLMKLYLKKYHNTNQVVKDFVKSMKIKVFSSKKK